MLKMFKTFLSILVAVAVVFMYMTAFTVIVHAAGNTYYVDSVSGNDSNNGTSQATPWRTFSKVNATTFQPGDRILFKADCVWNGQLWPKGSGSIGSPIIIDMYGTGNKPIFNGEGAVDETVRMYNQEYWEINNLEITNLGATPSMGRCAIFVQCQEFGTMDHIYVKNCYIHDVNAIVSDRYNDQGGIIFMANGVLDSTGTEVGYVPSNFNDLLIEGNIIKNVDYGGIFVRTKWKNRGSMNNGLGPWFGNTNVVIRGNNLDNIGGDGIVVCESVSPLVEYNVAKDCHIRCPSFCAAIWTINSDDALLQFNEAYLTRTDRDGQAYDADGLCYGTIFQYNYSHDNEGGFMLICDWGDSVAFNDGGIVRYNISQNDRSKIFHIAGVNTNFEVYNNTIYVGEGNDTICLRDWGTTDSTVAFYNNIFYNKGTNFAFESNGTVLTYDYNVYYGNHPISEPYELHKITADPMLVNPGSGGLGLNSVSGYKLLPGSPCIDSGLAIANNGGRDYYGNTVPYNGSTDIGAHEYVGDSSAYQPSIGTIWQASTGFSDISGNSQWDYLMLNGSTPAATTWDSANSWWGGDADYGQISSTLQLPTNYDSARTWTSPVNGTIRITGNVHKFNTGGGDGVVASIRKNGTTIWGPQTIAYNDATGFNHDISVQMNKGDRIYFVVNKNVENNWYDNTYWDPSITLTANGTYIPGVGSNMLGNPGFETGITSPWTAWNSASVSNTNQNSGNYCARLNPNSSYEQVINVTPNTTYKLTAFLKSATTGDPICIGAKNFGGTEAFVYSTSTTYNQVTMTFTTGPSATTATIYGYRSGTGTGAGYFDDVQVQKTNLLVNPGFETGTPSPWTAWNSSSVTNTNQNSGGYCAKLNPNSSYEQVINVTPNTTYTLSGWLKTESAEDPICIGVKNFGGNEIFLYSTSTTYKQVTLTFTTGPSATTATVYGYRSAAGTGVGYFDDVQVHSTWGQ